MKKILLSLAFSVALATSAMAAKVGDTVGVQFVCRDFIAAKDIIQAESADTDALIQKEINDGLCAVAPAPVAAILEKEYKMSRGLSVWKIKGYELFAIGESSKELDADDVR
jgi:hypothetical protein